MMTLNLDALTTTALALLLLGGGVLLKRHSRVLTFLCVPAPVVAGFGFALMIWLLRKLGVLELTLDTALQGPLMVAFFTTVGLGGSLGLLRHGGKTLFIYLGACWALDWLRASEGAATLGTATRGALTTPLALGAG